ncbi:MAG: serine/threonine protein kinase [Betaproteobacteria bacterium]|nr:serine/threonine protein kinase [Betaproteobacteria bacterium]
MATTIPSLPAGHTINEYRFDKLLGVGGFGLTYLATDTNLNLPVAIKEYLPADIASRDEDSSIRPSSDENRPTFEWGLTRFLDEARTLATFHHPNIVRVMRFFQANATAYMVMEFVQGASLSEWIKARRPLPQSSIEKIIVPLIEGLGTIHKSNYLHRDFKPGNIYIRKDGSPVLLDFGAARSTSGGKELTAVVSPGYAPVEQYSESSLQGPWTDLYAVGGVMYWLVTGNKPVDATARLRNDPQVPAQQIGDSSLYTADFLAAIDWALSPDERQRPQSAGELLGRLRGHAPATSVQADPERTVTVPVAALPDPDEKTQPIPQPVTAPPLDPAQLKELESELAQRIGPLASVLIKKAAKNHTSLDALIDAVAMEIDDENDRTVFKKKARGSTQPPPASRRIGEAEVATQLAATRFDLQVLERAEKRLAQHIGAIARVIVKKAAMKARDEGELYLIIADEIENPSDRKAFIKKAISASTKNSGE